MHLCLSSLAIIGLSATLVLSAPIPQMDGEVNRPLRHPSLRRVQSASDPAPTRPIPQTLLGAPPLGVGQAQTGRLHAPPAVQGQVDTSPRSAGSPPRDQEPLQFRQNTPVPGDVEMPDASVRGRDQGPDRGIRRIARAIWEEEARAARAARARAARAAQVLETQETAGSSAAAGILRILRP